VFRLVVTGLLNKQVAASWAPVRSPLSGIESGHVEDAATSLADLVRIADKLNLPSQSSNDPIPKDHRQPLSDTKGL